MNLKDIIVGKLYKVKTTEVWRESGHKVFEILEIPSLRYAMLTMESNEHPIVCVIETPTDDGFVKVLFKNKIYFMYCDRFLYQAGYADDV